MAKGNTYICATCGESFQFCPKCAVTQPAYDAQRYCCKEHADIFAILSKQGCGLISTEEAYTELEAFDIPKTLNASVKAHIDSIKDSIVRKSFVEKTTKKK